MLWLIAYRTACCTQLWKKEQEHAAELKRAEEFRKQIAEERQKKELEEVAVAAGVKV